MTSRLEIALGHHHHRRHAPGTRKNPVTLRDVDDLERATRRVARPSENQAHQGNYEKGHVIVGGLHVTIENPRGTLRYGTNPDGKRWHVTMPADYGYIKRTMADDGDQVDVYLGPNSHEAEIHPVWIVDQIHPHSGKYDEPKCMVGFPSSDLAQATYMAGFSDNSGPWRVGAVARMTFGQFKNWLRNGNTKEPLLYRVMSALKKHDDGSYCGPACPCTACSGIPGGIMSTTITDPASKAATPEQAGASVKFASALTSSISKLLGFVPAAERKALFEDASIMAETELGKAASLLETGDDGGRIGMVQDLWSGAPDGRIATVQAHGPGSTAAPGKTNVGPVQAASGGGAAKMEPEYSNHAPQGGVQRATEMLGAEVGGLKGAMKSVIAAIEAQGAQIAAMKGGAFDQPAMEAMIAAAVAKALPVQPATDVRLAVHKAVRKAVRKAMRYAGTTDPDLLLLAKAEEKEEEHEEEEPDHEKVAAEMHAEDGEKESEKEEEKEAAKSAARLRLLAKGCVKRARAFVEKAEASLAAGNPVLAKGETRIAKSVLKKASAFLDDAVALRGGVVGPSTKSIIRKIEKAAEARKAVRRSTGGSQANNQNKWPASTPKRAAEGEAEKKDEKRDEEMKKALDQISKALHGMGLLQTDVQRMMGALSGQVQAVATGGDGVAHQLPPVFALAKAGGDAVQGARAALANLRDTNVITFADFDRSLDVLQSAQMGLPSDIVEAKVKQLPPAAREALSLPRAA